MMTALVDCSQIILPLLHSQNSWKGEPNLIKEKYNYK